ncbi:MAG: hypothetical protein QQN63_06455 [Nitrosopumilus sp.]
MKKQILLVVVCGILILMFAGCNAFAGLGRDMTNTASWLDDKITDGFHSSTP